MNSQKWLSTWGCAPSFAERRVANYTKNVTLRYVVRSAFDGEKIRVKFSNVCNFERVTIDRVSVALTGKDPCSIDTSTLKAVTFGGSEAFSMEQNEYKCSDEIDFAVKKGQNISISFYFASITQVNCGTVTSGDLSIRFMSEGDRTRDEILPVDCRHVDTHCRFLNTVDVLTDENCRSIVAFGDSITSMAWPEMLHTMCIEGGKNTGIVRRAISGSRILRQYDAISYRHYGPVGTHRIDHELDASASDTVVVLHGINDIIHPDGINPLRPMSHFPSAEELINGLRAYIKKAHENGMKIYLCTIMPIEGWRTYEEFRNEVRCAVNDWIRVQTEADGFIDLDKALGDPQNPNALLPEYDKGDHLHPSDAGSKAIAEAVHKAIIK